jgi:ribosomal protein S18 acetylase RimI-like enzyme
MSHDPGSAENADIPRLPWITQTRDARALILRIARPGDAAALIAATDAVARERRYFLRSRFQHDVEVEREFINLAHRSGNLVLVTTVDGVFAGWLTLQRQPQEFRRHVVELGMGVLIAYRGVGVGKALLGAALAWAARAKVEKIELSVRATNERARKLYEQAGFVSEGCRKRAIKDDLGAYDDLVLMARLLA